jgi:hypothetical protein
LPARPLLCSGWTLGSLRELQQSCIPASGYSWPHPQSCTGVSGPPGHTAAEAALHRT